MPVLKVVEVPGRTLEVDEKGYVQGTRKWKFFTSGLNTSPLDVYAALPVQKYDSHPDDAGAIARTARFQQDELGGVVWTCEVPYSSAPFEAAESPGSSAGSPPSNSNNQSQPPELRPPIWSFDKKDYLKPVTKDQFDESPIVNSAGLPFPTPVEVEASNLLIRVEFFTLVVTVSNLRSTWNKVNDAAWQGFPKWTLLVRNYNAKSQYEKVGNGMIGTWQVALELEHNEDVWNPTRVLDAGSVEKVIVSSLVTRYQQVTDDSGNPIVMPLNGSGRRLNPGEPLVYLPFNLYKEISFSGRFF